VLCALLLNLSIIIVLSTAAIFLSNINSTSAPKSSAERAVAGADTKLVLAVFQGHTEWELVPLLLDCLFMLAVLVLLIDGHGICYGRP